MKEKINIAEILKDKPQGTKLYNWLYNTNVELDSISTTDKETAIWCTKQKDINTTTHFGFSKLGTMKGCLDGLQILLPSKEMRDWRKFSWEKGDVLVSEDRNVHIIFEKFEDDAYTKFRGKHYLWEEGGSMVSFEENEYYMQTSDFNKANKEDAQTYINTIEEKLGGKLNRETLEVQANINVGDVVSDDVLYGICTKVNNSNVYCDFGCDSANYNAPITKLCLQKENVNVVMPTNKEAWYKEIEKIHHISIDRNTLEVQQEFKDGDIVVYGKSVAICRKIYEHTLSFYVSLNEMFGLLFSDEVESSEEYRFATEEEKQQLFDALEKEGKAWDAVKKMIVNLKPKVELRPFDKVLCRNSKDDTWEADFFARLTRKEIDYTQSGKYLCVGDLWMYCIPYNEETAHLLGTTDEWKGGEG